MARFFPFATRTVSAMLLAINPELEQSARASGASWLQTMRYVLVPLLLPAIIAAWLMLFVIFIRELVPPSCFTRKGRKPSASCSSS